MQCLPDNQMFKDVAGNIFFSLFLEKGTKGSLKAIIYSIIS